MPISPFPSTDINQLKDNLIEFQFVETLRKISCHTEKKPRCFISYAWGIPEHERLVYRLAMHLKEAGIQITLDVWDNKTGTKISKFTESIHESDYVILIGSQQLLEKYYNKRIGAILNLEVDQIIEKLRVTPNSIIPLLLEGATNTSFPPAIQPMIYLDFRDTNAYYLQIFNLLERLLDENIAFFKEEFTKQSHYFNFSESSKVKLLKDMQAAKEKDESLTQRIADNYINDYKAFINNTYTRRVKYYGSFKNITYLLKKTENHPLLTFSFFIGALCILYFIYNNNIHFFIQGHSNTDSFRNTNSLFKTPEIIQQEEVWNLPYALDHYIERKELTDKIWDVFSSSDKGNRAIQVGLYGLGGIGKTSLATYIIRNPPRHYEFKGWFSAETKDLLKNDYLALGKKHELFPQNDVPDDLEITLVKEWLQNQKNILLVYDNAPDMETLQEFLPNKGHILITSINYKFPGAIEIDVMTEIEALNLLSLLVPKAVQEEFNYQQHAKKLVRELGCFPLALCQAGYYINENNMTVSKYLDLYATEHNALLNANSLPPGDKHRPVYVTWELNIKQIKKLENGEMALKLLDFISYCYPENIPQELLIQYLYGNSTNKNKISFYNTLILLKKYSLIKILPSSISIHGLVQNFIRKDHNNNLTNSMLNSATASMVIIYPFKSESKKDIKIKRTLLPHIKSILSYIEDGEIDNNIRSLLLMHADAYQSINDYINSIRYYELINKSIENLSNGCSFFPKIYSGLGYNFRRLGDLNKARLYYKKELNVKLKCFDNNDIEVADAYINLGITYLKLGKNQKSQEAYYKAELILSQNKISSGPSYARMINGLGLLDLENRQYANAKEKFDKALLIAKEWYGEDHPDTAIYSHNIATACAMYGDLVEARNLFENALYLHEKEYGKNNQITSYPLHSLGEVNYLIGNYKESRSYFNRTLKIALHNNVTSLTNVKNSLFVVDFLEGNIGKNLEELEESCKKYTNEFGLNHKITCLTLINLSIMHKKLNNIEKHNYYFNKSKKSFLRIYGNEYTHIFEEIQKREHLFAGEICFDRIVYKLYR